MSEGFGAPDFQKKFLEGVLSEDETWNIKVSEDEDEMKFWNIKVEKDVEERTRPSKKNIQNMPAKVEGPVSPFTQL